MYEYDFFISFPAECPAGKWVIRHFEPLLRDAIQDSWSSAPNYYIFTEKPVGANWQNEVKNALKKSKVLVPILTPPYFHDSKWCRAEYETFVRRHEILDYCTERNLKSLIYPVVFSDGEHFPPSVKSIRQKTEMKEFNYPDEQFKDSQDYLGFRQAVRKVAEDISVILNDIPEYDDTWPVVDPEDIPTVSGPVAGLPRIGDDV